MLFGSHDQVSGVALVMTLPIAVREFTIGIWMIVKGFRTPSIPIDEVDDAPVATQDPAFSTAVA